MNSNDTRLAGRTALVTGSTGGLGKSIAKALAAAEAFVVVTGRDKVRGDAVVAEINAVGGEAAFVAGDLGVGQAEVRRVVDAAVES
ncbi:MAG: SDR family NAD(P)-dependent oxidoreductase, partial [Mycobacterium sp.]